MSRVPDFEYPVIHPLDVEREAVCEDCGSPFRTGDRYASRLLGAVGHIPITEAICLSCENSDDGPSSGLGARGMSARLCESGCGCRYGTDDPDRLDCACDGPCCLAEHEDWFGSAHDPDRHDVCPDCGLCPVCAAELARVLGGLRQLDMGDPEALYKTLLAEHEAQVTKPDPPPSVEVSDHEIIGYKIGDHVYDPADVIIVCAVPGERKEEWKP